MPPVRPEPGSATALPAVREAVVAEVQCPVDLVHRVVLAAVVVADKRIASLECKGILPRYTHRGPFAPNMPLAVGRLMLNQQRLRTRYGAQHTDVLDHAVAHREVPCRQGSTRGATEAVAVHKGEGRSIAGQRLNAWYPDGRRRRNPRPHCEEAHVRGAQAASVHRHGVPGPRRRRYHGRERRHTGEAARDHDELRPMPPDS